MNNKLFVYGTLKVGGHFAKAFDANRLSAVPATISGRMFSVEGRYPALISDPDAVVHGELHEYKDFAKILPGLDRIEGYRGPGCDNLYNRESVVVNTEGGVETALAYFFARDTTGMVEVEDGYWPIKKG